MSRLPLTSGSILQIDLYWRTDSLLSQRYKVFIHLVDPGGHLISQRDSEPGGGLELTTTWQVGQVYTDRHGLLIPQDLPAGRYSVLMGLYELGNPTNRLPVSGELTEGDSFQLGEVSVQ